MHFTYGTTLRDDYHDAQIADTTWGSILGSISAQLEEAKTVEMTERLIPIRIVIAYVIVTFVQHYCTALYETAAKKP